MTTIALAVPHTPWVPERAESMARLREAAGLLGDFGDGTRADFYREFTERAPNHVWCVDMWDWMYNTGADLCLTLQDDVMVAPCFWPALRAMLAALPEDADVVALTSVHPMAPDVAKRGHRWIRTPGQIVGWAYAIRREALGEFLEGRKAMPEAFRKMNEDEQVGEWVRASGRSAYQPVPTIVDHDTSIPSSYSNDKHSHRRPQVTWREFSEGQLTDPTWWKPSGEPELLPVPAQFDCWACGKEPGAVKFVTGLRLGKQCVAALLSNLVNRL